MAWRTDTHNLIKRDVSPLRCTPAKARRECAKCWEERGPDDVYNCNGFFLCGDCRYRIRHGKEPPHDGVPPRATANPDDDDEARSLHGTMTHNLSRHVYCVSETHYRTLKEIE